MERIRVFETQDVCSIRAEGVKRGIRITASISAFQAEGKGSIPLCHTC